MGNGNCNILIDRRSALAVLAGAAPLRADDGPPSELWVLAGQSNMQGAGLLPRASSGDDRIRNYSFAGRWVNAVEPLHDLWNAKDPAYWPDGVPAPAVAAQRKSFAARSGAGLGLPFALARWEKTGKPVGLIPCALSGTAIAEWSPKRRAEGERSLYRAMLNRIRDAGGRPAGVLWYQGEADGKPDLAPTYKQSLVELIHSLRKDLNADNLPFYFVQIGRHVHDPQASRNGPAWNLVQESQRQVELEVPNTAMVASLDLEMDDGIHIGTDGLKELGRRLALVAGQIATAGPRPVRAVCRDRAIHLTLSGVNGRIEPAARLSGFAVADSAGRITPRIYRVIAGGTSLLLPFDGGPTPPAFLWYGRGKDPYCNIRDSQGMALPAFGPFPVENAP